MNYRERFHLTINHKKADRVPFDFCGTSLTSCHSNVLSDLAKYYSISADNETDVTDKIQTIFDIDFRRVGHLFQPESGYSDYSNASKGEYTDPWGIKRKFQGLYWDILYSPFKDKELSEIKDFKWPSALGIDKKSIAGITEKTKRLYYDTDYVIVAEHPVFGFFELGCWMFGFEDFLYRLLEEEETVNWFFNHYNKYVRDVIELYYSAIGPYIHVTTSGDDFGMQNGPFMSPLTFKERISPWYKSRISYTKQFTNASLFHHTCGSVYRLLDEIINMGVDILNPVQPGTYEMEPEKLKREFGDRIVFWGAIDEQNILSSCSAEAVKKEVLRVENILNKNGGYILAASHNIQPDVPVENIIALFKALI